jgi:hypothetical protein
VLASRHSLSGAVETAQIGGGDEGDGRYDEANGSDAGMISGTSPYGGSPRTQTYYRQVGSDNRALLHLVKDLRGKFLSKHGLDGAELFLGMLETSIRSPLQTAADETKRMKEAGDDMDELENVCANVSDSLEVVRTSTFSLLTHLTMTNLWHKALAEYLFERA